VAADTILLGRDAEGLYSAVASPASFSFFHLGHGVMPTLFQIEDGVMANFTVVVFGQMVFMAENHRISIFERKFYLLGFGSTGANGAEHYNQTDQHHRDSLHGFILLWTNRITF